MREAAEKRRKLWILLLAVICSSFVVANSSVMPVQAAEDTDANTGEVVTSGTFGEYNGEIYTVDKVANTVLYRRNMRDGSVSQYDFGGMNLYISGCNEVGDATFFIQFLPDQGENNTELWRLDRSTGEKERIATWYNENAENAAEEP